jgi:hypothetical protein
MTPQQAARKSSRVKENDKNCVFGSTENNLKPGKQIEQNRFQISRRALDNLNQIPRFFSW